VFIKQLLPRLTIHPLPLYESGSAPCLRTHKYKVNRAQEFVIGGYTPGNPLDALIVGYYEGERLLYAAKVRNGFVPQLRRDVGTKFKGLQIDACPFANLPERKRTQWALTKEEMKDCVWLKPELVAQIEFTEWTTDGHLTLFGRVRELAGLMCKSNRSGGCQISPRCQPLFYSSTQVAIICSLTE